MPAATATTSLSFAHPSPWWADPRFQLPMALVGASAAAVGAFALLHYGLRPPLKTSNPEITPALRDGKGDYFFPEQGYVLCPHGAGIAPTSKPIHAGTFVVLWLGTPGGEFVERTWAQVLKVDTEDTNRVLVVVRGELGVTGPRTLQHTKHGFALSQKLWVTKDCIPDAYNELDDPNAVVMCGVNLISLDGPDDDLKPDGYGPAAPPALSPKELVGWQVELLLASRSGRGTAWQVPMKAEIIDVGPTGDVPRVRLLEIGHDPFADAAAGGHKMKAGDEIDAPWDCITRYLWS